MKKSALKLGIGNTLTSLGGIFGAGTGFSNSGILGFDNIFNLGSIISNPILQFPVLGGIVKVVPVTGKFFLNSVKTNLNNNQTIIVILF